MNSREYKIRPSNPTLVTMLSKLTTCLIIILLLGSCASPTATMKKDVSVEKYKVVYLHSIESPQTDSRNIFPQVVSRLEKLGFVVKIFNDENPIAGTQGSGFVVSSKGYILTCAHILEKEKLATVWIKGKRYESTVIKADKDKDLALLKIHEMQNMDLKAIPIKKTVDYKMGQEVYSMGFPLSDILGNAPRLNKGLISATVGLKDNPDHVQISVELQSGNSGSPLIDKNGNVIGLIDSTLNPISVLSKTGGSLPQNVNFAIKTKLIREFLSDVHDDITSELDNTKEIDFETAAESVAQVRAGNVSEDYLKQPKMVCFFAYQSFWDLWYRFRYFHIEFFDMDSGDLLLKAGQYRDNPLSSETKVLDETFAQIQDKFFPNLKR